MTPRPRARRRQAGLTMVELLVTLVITAFGFAGLLAATMTLSVGTGSAERMQGAVTAGMQTLEELRAKRITDMTAALTGSPTSAPPFTRSAYRTVVGRNGVTYTVDIEVDPVSPALWRLRAEVTWTEDGEATPRAMPLELLRLTSESL